MREIEDILLFRGDLSPFLVHLTRNHDGVNARTRLRRILEERQLVPGNSLVSDARFGGFTNAFNDAKKRRLFSAICFTETPLSEIHCMLEIERRLVDLEPYGVVFLKDRLRNKRVSPVIYINNEDGHGDDAVQALFSLHENAAASRFLPLVSVFGLKVHAPGAQNRSPGELDFLWEREWRRPADFGDLAINNNDIFCGLCPHGRIEEFEEEFEPLRFIDPTRNMKWYAQALIDCRQRLNLKHSVV
jgi:hypothetical protein